MYSERVIPTLNLGNGVNVFCQVSPGILVVPMFHVEQSVSKILAEKLGCVYAHDKAQMLYCEPKMCTF
jgi:hypothetical protein